MLPEVLLTTILLKLPIKTLLVCRSVCKTWFSLITSSHFITTHLNFNTINTPHILLRHCNAHENENYALYYDNESFDLCTKFEFPFKSLNRFFRVIGCCNGLICLSDDYVIYTGKIIIWNPSVKKAINLSEPIVGCESRCSFKHSLGFGFDLAMNDYKVVRITHVESKGIYPRVEVYRLSTRIWEDVSHLALPYYIVERSIAGYVNGAAHWIGWDEDCKHVILLFDMRREVFCTMMLPSSLVDHVSLWGDCLFNCQGLLCLIHNSCDKLGNRRFDIWLMKEYGATESWIKQLYVDDSSLRRPLSFRHNGEILWLTKSGYLISYLSQNKEIKDLGIRGSERFLSRFSFYVGAYRESLALLDDK